MDLSSKQVKSRARRHPLLAAESLEGRQLLSTSTTGAPAVADVAAMPTLMHGSARIDHGHAAFGQRLAGRMTSAHRFADRMAPAATTATPTAAAAMPTAAAMPAAMTDPTAAATAAMTPTAATATATATTPTTPVSTPSAAATAAPTAWGPMSSAPTTGMSDHFDMSEHAGLAQGGRTGGFLFGRIGGMASTAATTTTDPVQVATTRLRADEAAIAGASQVTPAMQTALRADLTALRTAATTAPTSATVLALQSDIISASGNVPSTAQLATIRGDLAAVATSEGITDTALVDRVFTDYGAILAASNVGSAQVATLTADLKAAGLGTTRPLGPALADRLGISLDALFSGLEPPVAAATALPTAATPMMPATPTPATPTTTSASSTS